MKEKNRAAENAIQSRKSSVEGYILGKKDKWRSFNLRISIVWEWCEDLRQVGTVQIA